MLPSLGNITPTMPLLTQEFLLAQIARGLLEADLIGAEHYRKGDFAADFLGRGLQGWANDLAPELNLQWVVLSGESIHFELRSADPLIIQLDKCRYDGPDAMWALEELSSRVYPIYTASDVVYGYAHWYWGGETEPGRILEAIRFEMMENAEEELDHEPTDAEVREYMTTRGIDPEKVLAALAPYRKVKPSATLKPLAQKLKRHQKLVEQIPHSEDHDGETLFPAFVTGYADGYENEIFEEEMNNIFNYGLDEAPLVNLEVGLVNGKVNLESMERLIQFMRHAPAVYTSTWEILNEIGGLDG